MVGDNPVPAGGKIVSDQVIGLTSPTSQANGATTVKGRCQSAIVGLPFDKLDRRLRQDIVAMDGATVLDYHGDVLAAGAIVKVDAGSEEGEGRLAAARRLSKYGCAIKVSSDGGIRGFKHRHNRVEEFFPVG